MASSSLTESPSENVKSLKGDKVLRKSSHKRKRENESSASSKSRKSRKEDTEEEKGNTKAQSGVQASEEENKDDGADFKSSNIEDAGNNEEGQAIKKAKRKDRSKSSRKDGFVEDTVKKLKKNSKADEKHDENKPKKRHRKHEKREETGGIQVKGDEEKAQNGALSEVPDPEAKKYASIMSKYSKAAANAEKIKKELDTTHEDKEFGQDDEEEKHGLEPLPQPAPAPQLRENPTYSTLPKWLAEPLLVAHSERRQFADLGVSEKMLPVLDSCGYKEAFPIQSAVCQLLRAGQRQHTGDICISAATGSGKTLAYALPVVSSIEYSPLPQLRGLIVVPTRELVRQARDTCEMLAAGKGLRIATAVGTASLREEQSHIMRDDQVYDPIAYKEQEEKIMDSNDWKNFSLKQYISELPNSEKQFFNHVVKPTPDIDILVCTPGRLVDHIRSTKGFSLEHLQWLIIDEADRLLNESFQEWVDTVIPALNTTPFFRDGPAAKTLKKLNHPMRKHHPLRKIILSATMTRDIEKLNSLRLQNPRLVVVGQSPDEETEEATKEHVSTDEYTLPPTLRERYIPVGDGAEKPVQLLALLLSKIKILEQAPMSVEARASSPSSSSSSSASSNKSDDYSSDSDSSMSASDDGSSDDSDISDESGSDTSDSDSDSSSDSDTAEAPDVRHVGKPNSAIGSPSHPTALIFTKSSEAAARLSRLLAILCPPLAPLLATLTKTNSTRSMRRVITAYRQGRTRVIIATDRASRGLDLPALGHVVCYDVPTSVTSYVHRIGRTARAGRDGYAWTLVARREGRWFSSEIGGINLSTESKEEKKKSASGKIKRDTGKKIGKTVLKISEHEDVLGVDIKTRYKNALAELGSEVAEQETVRRS